MKYTSQRKHIKNIIISNVLVSTFSIISFSAFDQAHASGKLQSLFQLDTLGSRLPYLESVIGPAKTVNNWFNESEHREYIIEGCKVTVFVAKDTVQGLSLELSPKCNFKISNFTKDNLPDTRGMTVSSINRAFPGLSAQSECIMSCGNAAEPTLDFTWKGSHAQNFIQVSFTITPKPGPFVDFETKITAKEGEDYAMNLKFNCDHKYDALAVKEYANARIEQVSIGYYVPANHYDTECAKK